ncbi:MAG: type 1 glutamine amidotransferase [Beijerinckiaceae bacterium]
MKPLRFLVVEGNVREAREAHRSSFGLTPAESYASSVQSLEANSLCDIALPADDGANLPDAAGLESYDGIFLTGSALNIYDAQPAVARQIALMRSIYASRVPAFGSCWGLQVGTVAAGGVVHLNPRGWEIGFARNLSMTEAGRNHPMLAGRPGAWTAPAYHLDEVAVMPGEATVLAHNSVSAVQAAEYNHDGAVFWGVQYHPEFSLQEIAAILRRRAGILAGKGYGETPADVERYCDALDALHQAPQRTDLCWQLGLDEAITDPKRRMTEISNFIAHRVKPTASARGRA